jgi:hypothetical protein
MIPWVVRGAAELGETEEGVGVVVVADAGPASARPARMAAHGTATTLDRLERMRRGMVCMGCLPSLVVDGFQRDVATLCRVRQGRGFRDGLIRRPRAAPLRHG